MGYGPEEESRRVGCFSMVTPSKFKNGLFHQAEMKESRQEACMDEQGAHS